MMLISLDTSVVASLLVLYTGMTLAKADSQCYYLNGTATDHTFKPCFPDRPNSACCVTEKPNDAPNDICMQNGLCYSQDTGYSGFFFQNACTDKDWGSAECPRFCGNNKSMLLGRLHLNLLLRQTNYLIGFL